MKPRVLIVDDAVVVRLMIKDILEQNDYEVVGECCNGHEAIEKYKELRPDVMTLDIIMPEKDGIEALEEILNFDQKAKVVMLTAVDQREALLRAIKLGAVDYIVKPFEEERVLSAVQSALESD